MKLDQGFNWLPIGTTAVALALIVQPAWAAETEVTNIRLNPTSKGFELIFDLQGDNRPPIFTVSRGNSSIADINNTQLRLPSGGLFQQANPAPGIASIEVSQLGTNTTRVTVNGFTAAPVAEVIRRDGAGRLVLNFDRAAGNNLAQTTPVIPAPAQPPSMGSSPSPVPPFLPRAVAPPVGDIAVGSINAAPDTIDLGSSERIPRLLLREAPVREVLTLLARAAGVNVAFAEEAGGGGAAAGTAPAGSTISLDIENESVQDVFNYVLRMTGLQANRVGQTIFVGKTLPGDAQNRIVRTFRLNQIKATAETVLTQSLVSKADTGGNVSSSGTNTASTTAQTAISRSTTTTDNVKTQGAKEILQSYGANGGGTGNNAAGTSGGGSTLLAGLEVVADARANTITLIGTPRKVEIATSLLTQMDLRRRQVAVNVKFVDINLAKTKNFNTDFNFNSTNTIASGFIGGVFQVGAVLGQNFLLNLITSIRDQNAKILTNPTLLIQEGSSAQVNLTNQVFTGFEQVTQNIATPGGGTTTGSTIRPIIQNAGVILNVAVDRIDDNGFVTLDISPEVSSLSNDKFTDQFDNTANLLQQRRLETGQMRLRDGQTLILTGIIQDEDRVDARKVPILGDIPLLGRLFRREEKTRQRRELVVLVTPQILGDNDQSTFGYQYTPSPETQKLLNH